MLTTNLGKIRITYKGAYSALTEYSYLDVVTDSGNSYLYINLTPSTGTALSSAEHWDVVAEKGDQGIQGITGDSGIYVGPDEPTDPSQFIWIDDDDPYDVDYIAEVHAYIDSVILGGTS